MSPFVDALQRAMLLQRGGSYAEAEAIYRDILRQDPSDADALHYLGTIAFFREDHQAALALVEQALAIAPAISAAHNTRGNILLALDKPDEALAAYQQALAIKPHSVAALNNLGNILLMLERPVDALAPLDQVLARVADNIDALYNRGTVKLKLEWREEAIADFDRLLELQPNHTRALFNRAIALQRTGRIPQAIESYQRLLALEPDHGNSHFNLSLCQLVSGDLRSGFSEYEWRWRVHPQKKSPWATSPTRWLGKEDISNKTLLVHAEQGFGDTIQFSRFIPEVAKRAKRVVFGVQAPVKSLMAGFEPLVQVIAQGEGQPDYDVDCPLLSLPHVLNTTLETIPPPTTHLRRTPELIAKWRRMLPEKRGLRVGLAWSGRPDHPNDHHRSITAAQLLPLDLPGVTLISLQKEYREEDRAWLKDHEQILDYANHIGDFADTAALITHMDVVISVDTSVAHLAATLGTPVWVLLPFIAVDWRWLLARNDSPWYPAARLFRQPAADDWGSVIALLRGEVRSLLG